MQVREEHLPRPQHRALDRLGLLDLDDHLRPREHRLRIRGDGRARAGVARIVRADAGPRSALHDDVVTVQDGLVHAVRCETHAVLVILHLLRHANQHSCHRFG